MNISEENRFNERMIIEIGSQLITENCDTEKKNSLLKEFLGKCSLDNKSILLALESLASQRKSLVYNLELINEAVINTCMELACETLYLELKK